MSDYDANADARRVLQVNAAGTVVAPAAQVIGATGDNQADAAAPVHQARAFGFDGATWDALRTKGTGWQGVTLVRSSDGLEILNATADTSDAAGAIATGIAVRADMHGYNGATYDRQRNNVEATLLASAARTATQVSADITTYNARNLQVVLNMSLVGTGSVTVLIEGKDAASGTYFTLLQGAAVITNVTNRYRVSPDLTAAANSIAQDNLPRIIRITVTANNGNTATYSVGYVLGV